MTTGTWAITVAHREGHKRQYTQLERREPKIGEVIPIKDETGRVILAPR